MKSTSAVRRLLLQKKTRAKSGHNSEVLAAEQTLSSSEIKSLLHLSVYELKRLLPLRVVLVGNAIYGKSPECVFLQLGVGESNLSQRPARFESLNLRKLTQWT
jgi:hypothetical protein